MTRAELESRTLYIGTCCAVFRDDRCVMIQRMDIPNCFYRVSIKALVLDESRTKFLVVQEENGLWELPGGGLDWGMTPQDDLKREIKEEMGLEVTNVAAHPSYFLTEKTVREELGQEIWKAHVIYEVEVASLDFTPSDECVALRFVTPEEAQALTPQYGNIAELGRQFDSARHRANTDSAGA